MKKKIIWIDLDNSPHVPLFVPIARELEARACTVIVTARDFAQTEQLLKKTNLPFTLIGKHYGKNKIRKVLGLLIRVYQLIRFIRKNKIDFALNHGSRAHVLACSLLGIPVYCGADYEHTESFLFSRFSTKMWMPEAISEKGMESFGIKKEKVIRYPGYKEEFYLKDFIPQSGFKKENGIPDDAILVTLRPPATQANYHNENSEVILLALVQKLKSLKSVFVLCTPRTADQKGMLKKYEDSSFRVLDKTVDGLNLVYFSDLVISGGGTMNREAALLGTPVYSIFAGELGSLDAGMEAKGQIQFLRTINDLDKLKIEKKSIASRKIQIHPNLVAWLMDRIFEEEK